MQMAEGGPAARGRRPSGRDCDNEDRRLLVVLMLAGFAAPVASAQPGARTLN